MEAAAGAGTTESWISLNKAQVNLVTKLNEFSCKCKAAGLNWSLNVEPVCKSFCLVLVKG